MNARLLAGLLAGCCLQAGAMDLAAGTGAHFRLGVTSMKEARYISTIRQQYDFSCGSAAVATLLSHHFNYRVDEALVFQEMYARGDQAKIRREGFSLLDMKRFLEARGFKADGFQLPLQKLRDAGLPAIVLISENGYHHFVVVKGLRDGRVLLGDPASGTRAIAQVGFEAMWQTRLLFVVHNRPGAGRFNAASDWRVAPAAPLGEAVSRDSLGEITLLKHGGSGY